MEKDSSPEGGYPHAHFVLLSIEPGRTDSGSNCSVNLPGRACISTQHADKVGKKIRDGLLFLHAWDLPQRYKQNGKRTELETRTVLRTT